MNAQEIEALLERIASGNGTARDAEALRPYLTMQRGTPPAVGEYLTVRQLYSDVPDSLLYDTAIWDHHAGDGGPSCWDFGRGNQTTQDVTGWWSLPPAISDDAGAEFFTEPSHHANGEPA